MMNQALLLVVVVVVVVRTEFVAGSTSSSTYSKLYHDYAATNNSCELSLPLPPIWSVAVSCCPLLSLLA